MMTRKQLNIELAKLQEENERLRKEILIYNRLQSLNEAHLAVALDLAGRNQAAPLVVHKDDIRKAVEEMVVKVERDGDIVSLWCEVLGGEADGEEDVNVNAAETG